MNNFPLRDWSRMHEQSIVSRKTLRENIQFGTGIIYDDIYTGETKMARFRFQAEINPPEGYDETQQGFRWSTPFLGTNDLEAAKLWITQYILANPTTERSQAAIYQVTYRNMAGA